METQHHLLFLSPSHTVAVVNSVCWLCGRDLQPPKLPPALPGQAEVMLRGCQGWAAAWLLGARMLQMKEVGLGFPRALWASEVSIPKITVGGQGGRSDTVNSPVSLPAGSSALMGSRGDGSSTTLQHPSPDITFPEVPSSPPAATSRAGPPLTQIELSTHGSDIKPTPVSYLGRN